MKLIARHTPFAIFLVIALGLSHTSLFFPQRLGAKLEVAGWPLQMYVREYNQVTDVNSSGSIQKMVVPSEGQLLFGRVVLNILIWIVLLTATYWTYKSIELSGKKEKTKGNSTPVANKTT